MPYGREASVLPLRQPVGVAWAARRAYVSGPHAKSLLRDLDEWPVSDLDDDPTLWIELHPAAAQLTSGQRGEGERMDLVEYGRVVRRQAILVLIGLTITFAFMFLSLVRVSGDGMVFDSRLSTRRVRNYW